MKKKGITLPSPHTLDYHLRPVRWLSSTKAEVQSFSHKAQADMGYALYVAQMGKKHPDAKPLKGFGGAGVLEIISIAEGDTYRIVYTVKFRDSIYVLHAFQKKSKSGIRTPKKEIELIRQRLVQAYDEWKAATKNEKEK